MATCHKGLQEAQRAEFFIDTAKQIFGSNDRVAKVGDINKNKSKLPTHTTYVSIGGANHAQFGYYGFQLGDDKAGITRAEHQQITLDNILSFIVAP